VSHPDPTPPPPSGIILDEKGNIYLLDPKTNILRRIGPDGELTVLSGPAGHPSALGDAP